MQLQNPLSDNILLPFIGKSNQFVLLLNSQLEIQWVAHADSHKYRDVVEQLSSKPLRECFVLPESDLDILFSDTNTLAPGKMLVFPSKNVAERWIINAFFIFSKPLSMLHILKLPNQGYLGVIVLSPAVMELSRFRNHIVAMTDLKNRIIGYSSMLKGLLKPESTDEYIGRDIASIFEFSPPLQDLAFSQQQPLKKVFDWNFAEGPAVFKTSSLLNPEFAHNHDGLLWKNSREGYCYLDLPGALSTDTQNFRLQIEFIGPLKSMLNLIWRGTTEASSFPDNRGYNLSITLAENLSFLLKKATDPVLTGAVPFAHSDIPHRLTLAKSGQDYAIEMDNIELGLYHEAVPFILPSDDRFCLFLRPSESIVLRSISLEQGPDLRLYPGKAAPKLTAALEGASGNFEFNVSAIQGLIGKDNCLTWQFDDITALKENIHLLTREKTRLESRLRQEQTFIGRSAEIERIKAELPTVAASDLSVLIEGETGTGKEVLAQMIHNESVRRKNPFIKIDCSAIPADLMESELFGHERGSFTGATASHTGRFEQAQGGTVFLDEISNIPYNVQAKLLSVLQDYWIQKVGGTKPIHLDIRLIAASNIPLKALVDDGRFRKDLYFRLNQYRFFLPPLRQRLEDIPVLADHFINEANKIYKKKVQNLSPAAHRKIMQYPWPGNIREFRNAMTRAILFSNGNELTEANIHLESEAVAGSPETGSLKKGWGGARSRCNIKKEDIIAALKKAQGNISIAAGIVGASRFVIYKLIKEYDLTLDDYRIS